MVKVTLTEVELELVYLGLMKIKAEEQFDEVKIRIQNIMDYLVRESVLQEDQWYG